MRLHASAQTGASLRALVAALCVLAPAAVPSATNARGIRGHPNAHTSGVRAPSTRATTGRHRKSTPFASRCHFYRLRRATQGGPAHDVSIANDTFVSNLAAWMRVPRTERTRLLTRLHSNDKHPHRVVCRAASSKGSREITVSRAAASRSLSRATRARRAKTASARVCAPGPIRTCTADTGFGFSMYARPIITSPPIGTGGADNCIAFLGGQLCDGALWGQDASNGRFGSTVLTLGAAGFAEGAVQEGQVATYTSQAPRGQKGLLSVKASETVIELDITGGVASAACYPAELALFVEGVAAYSPDILGQCWSSTQIAALLPNIPDDATGSIGALRRVLDAVQNGDSALTAGLSVISLAHTIISQASQNLAAPPSDLPSALLGLGCESYDIWLFGQGGAAASVLPPCTQSTFTTWSGSVAGAAR